MTSPDQDSSTKLEFAFYQEGYLWKNGITIKNALLFFEGLAFLVPVEKESDFRLEQDWLLSALEDYGLLRTIRPGQVFAPNTANEIRESVEKLRQSQFLGESGLDLNAAQTASLDLTKLGIHNHPELVSSTLKLFVANGLATYEPGTNTLRLAHRLWRSVVHLVNVKVSECYSADDHVLRPLYDSDHATLGALRALDSRHGRFFFCPILDDSVKLGLDVGHVPLDELLAYRSEHLPLLRAYKSHATLIALAYESLFGSHSDTELLSLAKVRTQELREIARELEKGADDSWRTGLTVVIDAAGTLKNIVTMDYIDIALDLLSSTAALPQKSIAAYGGISYLLGAHRL